MDEVFDVMLAEKCVGSIRVADEGLYRYFSCQCRIPGREVSRLFARCGERKEKLGVLIPDGEFFCLETKIPAKRLGEGKWEYYVVNPSVKEPEQVIFLPICPEQPFDYIEQLKGACLAVRNQQSGALIRNPEDQSKNL